MTESPKEAKKGLKSKSVRSILISVVSLLIILAFVYYLYHNADKYRELLHITGARVGLMFALCLTFPLLNGIQNTYLYRSLGANISFRDGFYLTAVSTLANQLPISGGVVSKGVYLKYKYNLSYARFISSTFALFFCFIAVNGFTGIMVLIYWAVIRKVVVSSILWIAFSIMTFCFLVFWLPLDRIKMPKKIREWVLRAVEGWMLISTNPKLLLRLVGLQILLVMLLALRYWLAFHMLSQDVTMGQTLLFASASILTQVVSIAPGGLGIREAIVGAVAAALGFDAGTSVVAVGLDRLVMTVMIVLTGLLSIIFIGKLPSATEMKAEDQG